MLETLRRDFIMSIQVLKVSGTSNINAVSEAIIKNVVSDSIVHVDCIGVKASYTVTKALIQVTEYLVENCYKFNMRPYYIKVQVNGQDEEQKIKTAIRWTLIAKKK